MIRGIWGDQGKALHPEQWVSVYWMNAGDEAEYYGTCQVKDLEAIADGEPLENFGLVLDGAVDQGQSHQLQNIKNNETLDRNLTDKYLY